jgi:hypothetical protein
MRVSAETYWTIGLKGYVPFAYFVFSKLSCVYGCYRLVSNVRISGCLLSCVYWCDVFCVLLSSYVYLYYWISLVTLCYVGLLYCGCIAVLLQMPDNWLELSVFIFKSVFIFNTVIYVFFCYVYVFLLYDYMHSSCQMALFGHPD